MSDSVMWWQIYVDGGYIVTHSTAGHLVTLSTMMINTHTLGYLIWESFSLDLWALNGWGGARSTLKVGRCCSYWRPTLEKSICESRYALENSSDINCVYFKPAPTAPTEQPTPAVPSAAPACTCSLVWTAGSSAPPSLFQLKSHFFK